MFALLVGINEYQSTGYPSLRGAEPDACRWRDFLTNYGGLDSHITLLLGPDATREAFEKAFKDLANNPLIGEGDPIVIFYAGHGGEILRQTPDGQKYWIQMVVPYDYCMERGSEVHCISDMEIGMWIDRIAEKKGDNITVIMDCCHSASGTRGSQNNEIRVRSMDLPPAAYNPDIDREIPQGPKDGRYWRAGLRSHMLLAACASTEKAHERPDGGHFSTALLDLLCTVPLDQLRYCDILPRMKPISQQNPQCEGFNKHRFLFNTNFSCTLCPHYKIEFKERLILDAGSAPGQQTYLGLFIPRQDKFQDIFNKEFCNEPQSVTLVNEEDMASAHLEASMGDTNEVTFQLQDRRVTRHGFKKRYPSINTTEPAEFVRVLSGIACYYRELDHVSINSNIANEIDVGFYKLDDSNGSDWRKFVPEGENLFRNGFIDFEVEEGAPYGLKLVNKSACDLYPYLFFFNNNNFSIASLYETSGTTGYLVESPLKSKGFLTFGYGSGGVEPYTYTLDHEDRHVDFLKIIFTTQVIDIGNGSRPSPFQWTRAPVPYKPRYTDRGWDTLLIPFIQRRSRTKG